MALFGFHFLFLRTFSIIYIVGVIDGVRQFGGCGAARMSIYSVIVYREQPMVSVFTGQFYISVLSFLHHTVF